MKTDAIYKTGSINFIFLSQDIVSELFLQTFKMLIVKFLKLYFKYKISSTIIFNVISSIRGERRFDSRLANLKKYISTFLFYFETSDSLEPAWRQFILFFDRNEVFYISSSIN